MIGRTTCLGKRRVDRVRLLPERMNTPLYRGAAAALVELLNLSEISRTEGAEGSNAHVPAIWDENYVPLCNADAPVTSFPWTLHRIPLYSDAIELVCVMMERLDMEEPEVVTTVVILESFMNKHNGTLQPYSARPMLLACCILACKLTSDSVTTPECYEAVKDCFTGLTTLHVARIEEQMLVCLDWGFSNDPEVYRACAHNLKIMGRAAREPPRLTYKAEGGHEDLECHEDLESEPNA